MDDGQELGPAVGVAARGEIVPVQAAADQGLGKHGDLVPGRLDADQPVQRIGEPQALVEGADLVEQAALGQESRVA